MFFEKSVNWLIHSVAPTLSLIDKVDKEFETELLSHIIQSGKLGETHEKILHEVQNNPEWYREKIDTYIRLLEEKQKTEHGREGNAHEKD